MGLSTRQRFAAARASRVTPGGIFEMMAFQPSTGEVFDHHVQDVEPILKANKAMMREAEAGGGWSEDRTFYHVAQIPLIIVEKWLFEEGLNCLNKDHWPAVLAKLDQPEYLFLRTAPGRLSYRPVRNHPTTFGGRARRSKLVIARS